MRTAAERLVTPLSTIREVKPGSFIFERPLALPPTFCEEVVDRFEAHPAGELDPEMAESADAEDCNQIAGAGTALAQCVEGRDARTEQRRGLLGGELLGNRCEGAFRHDHMVCVATVESDARH